MKILDRVNIYRVEFFQPYPPNIGDFQFYCIGNTIEEVIHELCITKGIKPGFVRERSVISPCHCISTTLLDKLINQYLEEYIHRNEINKKKYDEYIEKQKVKPMNSTKQIIDYSVL